MLKENEKYTFILKKPITNISRTGEQVDVAQVTGKFLQIVEVKQFSFVEIIHNSCHYFVPLEGIAYIRSGD